jgi:predicted nucleotide-binding protein
MSQLQKDTVGELFMNIMQHIKCIEVRLSYARAATSQKQKYALNNAVTKVNSAINHICDLLGNSDMTMAVKKDLEKVDLVYVMVLTEQLFKMNNDDLEKVTDMIDQYLNEKYGKAEHQQV